MSKKLGNFEAEREREKVEKSSFRFESLPSLTLLYHFIIPLSLDPMKSSSCYIHLYYFHYLYLDFMIFKFFSKNYRYLLKNSISISKTSMNDIPSDEACTLQQPLRLRQQPPLFGQIRCYLLFSFFFFLPRQRTREATLSR